MIEAGDFLGPALARGFDFWSGVPCSFLTPFINGVIQSSDLHYVGATSEGEAVGICAGAHLAGRRSVVICQNSGLGNTVNPLTSLCYTFRIPILLVTTQRGAPGVRDEPQHELMGEITSELLDTLRIPWALFPKEATEVAPVLDRAVEKMETSRLPYALIMQKGTVSPQSLEVGEREGYRADCRLEGEFTRPPADRMSRMEAIRIVREAVDGAHPIIASTGKIGRELFTLGHRDNQLYVVGSMGCASALGLGLHEGAALAGRRRCVVVLDGDGAALMKMGNLATIGNRRPRGLLHIVLDNEVHDSTGGQTTVANTIDFATVAAGCGYRGAARVDDPGGLTDLLRELLGREGPNLLHVKVAPGTVPSLGRPTLTPVEVKQRLMKWLVTTES